jgi:hypothetical protein
MSISMKAGRDYFAEWDLDQVGAEVKVALCFWGMSSSCGRWINGTRVTKRLEDKRAAWYWIGMALSNCTHLFLQELICTKFSSIHLLVPQLLRVARFGLPNREVGSERG